MRGGALGTGRVEEVVGGMILGETRSHDPLHCLKFISAIA